MFDFETDGTDPAKCNPVQIAALAVDYRKMEIVENSEFCSYMKPPGIENRSKYMEEHQDTIDFHARNYGVTADEIVDKWTSSPDQCSVWKTFVEYSKRFKMKNQFGKPANPISCGANIIGFDLPIVQRLNKAHKLRNKVFHTQRILDVTQWLLPWLAASDLENISMDTLRPYFGIEVDGSHDAMKDVKDCAQIAIRFLQFQKTIAEKRDFFKGAFNVES